MNDAERFLLQNSILPFSLWSLMESFWVKKKNPIDVTIHWGNLHLKKKTYKLTVGHTCNL